MFLFNKNNRLIFYLSILSSIGILSCRAQPSSVFTPDEKEMMQHADSVILYRLDDEMSLLRVSPRAIPPNIMDLDNSPFDFYNTDRKTDYLKVSKRKMTKVEMEQLMKFVDQSSTITSNPIDNCRFAPGAGIKFYKGKERFYLLLCFNCDSWAFSRREAMYYIRFGKDDRKKLIEYAKKLFPADREFQSLN